MTFFSYVQDFCPDDPVGHIGEAYGAYFVTLQDCLVGSTLLTLLV